MMKLKTVLPFFFKDLDHQQVVDLLNEEFPISIKYSEDLVNRVHARYPLIEKHQVSIIIKAVFQVMRDLLVLGKVLTFNHLFFDFKFHVFTNRVGMITIPALKVLISTPPKLREKP
jgi:nucleoid DNA-binding protein